MKKISAVIANWNEKKLTSDCIRSLQEQDYRNLEIIVSDNGSTDGSVEHLKNNFSAILLLENGRSLGFGSAVNRGFEAATGDFLLFLNNDLVLRPDSIRELAWLLESDQHIGATVPKILYTDIPDKINSFGVRIHYTGIACQNKIDQKDSQDLSILETPCGGIFMLKREVFKTIGGFEENLFLYHEDHDLSWRIRLAGWKILVTPKAVIHHHYKFKKGARKYYSSEKNRLYLLLKNMHWRTLLMVSPALLLVELSQWVHALFNGWFFLKRQNNQLHRQNNHFDKRA